MEMLDTGFSMEVSRSYRFLGLHDCNFVENVFFCGFWIIFIYGFAVSFRPQRLPPNSKPFPLDLLFNHFAISYSLTPQF